MTRKTATFQLNDADARKLSELEEGGWGTKTEIFRQALDRFYEDESKNHTPPYFDYIDEFFTMNLTREGAVDRVRHENSHFYYLHHATEQDIIMSFVHGIPLWRRNIHEANEDDMVSVPSKMIAELPHTPTRYKMVRIGDIDWPREDRHRDWHDGI